MNVASMSLNSATASRPWYREPMVWLVAALPASVVIAGFATLAIAIAAGGADAVRETVQRSAQMQTTDLSPDRAALARALSGEVHVDADSGAVRVTLGGEADALRLRMQWLHPAAAERDVETTLVAANGGWLGRVDLDRRHDWRLVVSDDAGRWRLVGRLREGARAAELHPRLRPGG